MSEIPPAPAENVTPVAQPSVMKKFFTFDKTWKVVILLLVVFFAGGVAGAAVVGRLVRNAAAKALNPSRQTESILARLKSQLKLTDRQVESVRPIVQKATSKFQTMVDETRERSKAELTTALVELNAQLTPEQQEVLKRHISTMQKRAETFRARMAP
ncbi:MAG: hypothetical protein ACAI35_07785 [Candidatus Methylacidiphilales bacterium]